jgi:hypothetical protein
MHKTVPAFFCGLIFFIFSCGMEDYLYLISVDEGNIHLDAPNTTATIVLPNFRAGPNDEYNYFTHFSLFYRIYVSDVAVITTYPYYSTDLSPINNALANDFSALSYYTSNTTTVITNLGSQFSGRKYYPLELQDETGREYVLNNSFLGSQITLDFTPGKAPGLNISTSPNNPLTLRRTGGDGNFYPVPSNRLFFNTDDLNSSANVFSPVSSTPSLINNDVVDKASITGQRYTYVSIYIVTTGRDYNLTPIYSRPTHVGVFSLPGPVTGL